MKLKTIYICSQCGTESPRWAGQCFKCQAWNSLVEDVVDGPVLLHCVAGVSRSPALAICYLHERHGLSLLAAMRHVRSRRMQADPNPLFLRMIQDYYRARTGVAGGDRERV